MSAPADAAVRAEVARWQAGMGDPASVVACALAWAWGDENYARVLMERACYSYRADALAR